MPRARFMRIVQRPGFYLICLLMLAMLVLTLYLAWKLPMAEELARMRSTEAPGASSPRPQATPLP